MKTAYRHKRNTIENNRKVPNRRLFISYSHRDKKYVCKLAKALRAKGFEVWTDDEIECGVPWPSAIEAAIHSCRGFILVASNSSHKSEWVQNEVIRAKKEKKQVYPLLLRGSPWISFESTQYFDVRHGNLPDADFYKALNRTDHDCFGHFR